MSEESTSPTTKAPWHLWLVGIITLLWNCMGVLDFVMTNTKSDEWLKAYSEEQLAFLDGFPMWVIIAWAIAVFGAALGSLLILMRKQLAAPILVLSLLGLLVTTLYKFVMHNGLKIMGTGAPLVMTIVIMVVAVFLAYYSHSLKDKGLLK